MALLGIYVGVIPVAMGMLWMPFVRHSSAGWIRAMLGFTVGLLAFLTFDATLEAFELVTGNSSFGGPLVVIRRIRLDERRPSLGWKLDGFPE